MKIRNIITTIDTNTGGEPTRTVIGGIPYIPGNTMLEKMNYMKENKDWIRQFLMLEPRGNEVMSGAYLTSPCSQEADIGVIYIEVGCYLPMCGHDTIGVVTALIESGMFEAKEPFTYITLDTPAGVVRTKAEVKDNTVKSVSFENVPSFMFEENVEVDIPGYKNLHIDIGYGGNFYAIVKAKDVNIKVDVKNAKRLIEIGNQIKDAVNAKVKVFHPENKEICGVTHVEFSDDPVNPTADIKNAVIIIPGSIDRSPCGTGTSAKMAVLNAKGMLKVGDTFTHESIVGSIFKCKVIKETKLGHFKAIIPEICGSAYVTGINNFIVNPNDDLKYGFRID
ncbi:MAG: proline racemase family protein [Tissierellia bacterium]|nr:proline racemase family protein [Tissierellia bacterium]MDD4780892.1 proline racemase family protein [Tissierellia bacterium]